MTDDIKAAEKLAKRLDRASRADTAQSMLDEVMKDLENQCLQGFRLSKITDSSGHAAARYYLQVLDDVRERFGAFIADGEIARKDLERMKRKLSFRRTG